MHLCFPKTLDDKIDRLGIRPLLKLPLPPKLFDIVRDFDYFSPAKGLFEVILVKAKPFLWQIILDGEEDEELCSTDEMWQGVCHCMTRGKVIDVSKELGKGV